MRRRWRSLVRPEAVEHPASPNAGEALGVWMLGVLWALACLWLGYLGSTWILPGVLVAGLLAMWGWSHIEWLWWFPVVLVAATLLEPLSPLPVRSRFGPLVYIDLLTIGVAVVALARAVGLKRPLLPRTPVDGLVVGTLVLFGLTLLSSQARERAFVDFKQVLVRVVVFYATTTVASRPRGSRWVWLAFPVASALIGLHAVWASFRGPGVLAAYVRASDSVWGSSHGAFNTLLVALPVTIGLALDAGERTARRTWALAALVGGIGLVLHAARPHALEIAAGWASRWTALELCRAAMAWTLLVVMTRLSVRVGAARAHERPRWRAVTLAFVAFGIVELAGPALSGPAVPLLAVAAGLAVGTLRADQRAQRGGRRIEPGLAKAA